MWLANGQAGSLCLYRACLRRNFILLVDRAPRHFHLQLRVIGILLLLWGS